MYDRIRTHYHVIISAIGPKKDLCPKMALMLTSTNRIAFAHYLDAK
jgi:hypothetical protein